VTVLNLAAAAAVPADQADGSPLGWSLASVSEALCRLAAAAETPQAVAAATEAVWWITTADAALNRHHPGPYGRALAALDPAARRATERSLAGLRFIRSQLGYRADPADFIKAQPAPGSSNSTPAAAWTWSLLPPPSPQRAAAREASPYREYRAQLAGRPLGEALNLTAGFLAQAHAAAPDRRHGISAPAR
jgi:hypothetical protein